MASSDKLSSFLSGFEANLRGMPHEQLIRFCEELQALHRMAVLDACHFGGDDDAADYIFDMHATLLSILIEMKTRQDTDPTYKHAAVLEIIWRQATEPGEQRDS